MKWTEREDAFVRELARTTPFPYTELIGSFMVFCEHVEHLNMSEIDIKKGFTVMVVHSQITATPLPNVIARVGKILNEKPSWFQRVKWWFVNLKNKIKKWVKRK